MSAERNEILLLSARPDAHEPLISALSSNGVNVRVARHPDRALEMLRGPASMVLVDLVHGQALDGRVVATLNEGPSDRMVLALDDPRSHRGDAGAGLAVDGYCHTGGSSPVFHARPGTIGSGALGSQ